MGLNLSKVSFAYYVPKNIKQNFIFTLRDIQLNINSLDEFTALVGHTGSGKSTLVQLFNALQFPSNGKIDIKIDEKNYVIEKNIEDINSKKGRRQLNKNPKIKFSLKPIRKYTGLVFQFPEYQIFEETVLKDIMFGPKNFTKDVLKAKEEALKIADIMGITDLLDKSPFSLSGGQMRKVAIAGILASNPDILVLDEPTVGLDPITKRELLNLLKKLNEEYHKSIILITHDMDVVSEYAKRVLVLKEGKLMYDGSKEELFKNSSIIEDCNLSLPTIVKLLSDLNKKLQLNLDIYKYNINDAFLEIKKKLGEENEF